MYVVVKVKVAVVRYYLLLNYVANNAHLETE